MPLPRRSFLAPAAAALASCVRLRPRLSAPHPASRDMRLRRRVSGVAVIVRGGTPPDAPRSRRRPHREHHVLEVASCSKPVFAFGVVSEATHGAMDLDAPLAKLAPPPYPHVRRGGVDCFDDPRLAQVTRASKAAPRRPPQLVALQALLTFVDPPGAEWRYSGEGYVLLQRAIESARRETLDAFVRRVVFSPLAMKDSTFDPRAVHARANGHDRAGEPVPSSVDAEIAATSLLSTAADYARFVRRLAPLRRRRTRSVNAMLARQSPRRRRATPLVGPRPRARRARSGSSTGERTRPAPPALRRLARARGGRRGAHELRR